MEKTRLTEAASLTLNYYLSYLNLKALPWRELSSTFVVIYYILPHKSLPFQPVTLALCYKHGNNKKL